LAGELDIQGVIDAVGDRLREVFSAAALVIAWIDTAAGNISFPYGCEHGQRIRIPTVSLAAFAEGRRYYLALAAREPVRWNTQNEYREWGLFVAEGTDMSLSGVLAPIFAGDRLIGMISIESHARERAYGDADVRLHSPG